MKTPTRLAAICLLASSLLAQDPPTPPGGFGVLVTTVPVMFSDGVVTGMDIYEPIAAAGPTGWPCVMVMHGSDGSKNNAEVQNVGNYLAAAGYVAFAFTAPSRTPTTQERELLDTAESYGLAQAAIAATTATDPARLAATGFSGGGRKAYAGAAWSGRPLPLAGFVTDYPPLLAIATEYSTLDTVGVGVPDGVMVADHIVIDRLPADPLLASVDVGDFAAVQAALDTTYNQTMTANLATATVPALAEVAMQDFKILPNPGLDAWPVLMQGPKRLFLATRGHSTVDNAMETSVMQDLRRRWFDHFLKGVPNGVELEPEVEYGMQPTSTALHLNPTTIWEHRSAAVWPLVLGTDRYHLVGTQGLSDVPPAAVNLTNVVHHVVPAGYDIFSYVANGSGLAPANVTAHIAPSQEVFSTQPLTEDIEIIGRTVVQLTVEDSTGLFQLTAVLAHQDPAGVVHWITAGTAGNRSGTAGVTTMRIELTDVAQIVPAGNRLVLKITNLADINGPNFRRIRTVPYFESTTTRILVGPGNDNYLDVPVRPYQAGLLPRLAKVSAGAGFSHGLQLRGGPARAFQDYLVALGFTGEAPGFLLDGVQVPLNFDGLTGLALGFVNTPILPNCAGLLDAAGNASPAFALPAAVAPIFAGFRFTFAGLVFDGGGLLEVVGGPTTLVVDP